MENAFFGLIVLLLKEKNLLESRSKKDPFFLGEPEDILFLQSMKSILGKT